MMIEQAAMKRPVCFRARFSKPTKNWSDYAFAAALTVGTSLANKEAAMSDSKRLTTSPLQSYVHGLFNHFRAIMLLQHRGDGLALSDGHLAALAMVATLAAVATSLAAPSDLNPVQVAASFLTVVGFLYVASRAGRMTAAGFCIVHLFTEPMCLGAYSMGLPEVNLLVTVWVVAALAIFFFRAASSQPVAKR